MVAPDPVRRGAVVQQSAELRAYEWYCRQLSFPHTRLPAQSESRSQSPPPSGHGRDEVQQLLSFLPPLQLDRREFLATYKIRLLNGKFQNYLIL